MATKTGIIDIFSALNGPSCSPVKFDDVTTHAYWSLKIEIEYSKTCFNKFGFLIDSFCWLFDEFLLHVCIIYMYVYIYILVTPAITSAWLVKDVEPGFETGLKQAWNKSETVIQWVIFQSCAACPKHWTLCKKTINNYKTSGFLLELEFSLQPFRCNCQKVLQLSFAQEGALDRWRARSRDQLPVAWITWISGFWCQATPRQAATLSVSFMTLRWRPEVAEKPMVYGR